MKKTISILLIICTLTICLVSCGLTAENKITEEFITSKLSDSEGDLDGTLTITDGTSDDVLAFNYVVTGFDSECLMDKAFTRKAINKLLSNPYDVSYRQLKVCDAFYATASVVGIFHEDEHFDSNKYIEEILSIICDGNTKTYGDWTVSATVDQTSNILTIEAKATTTSVVD